MVIVDKDYLLDVKFLMLLRKFWWSLKRSEKIMNGDMKTESGTDTGIHWVHQYIENEHEMDEYVEQKTKEYLSKRNPD